MKGLTYHVLLEDLASHGWVVAAIFSDEPFWDGSMTADTRPGKLKTIADTRAWVRAFFDGTVRGDWAALKRLAADAGKSQPEVTVHVFGKMWR